MEDTPLAVTPVTLRPRFDPHAEGEPPAASGELRALPSAVDVRQMSLFGAVWTAGSLKYLSQGGAHSVTYYETTGWRGVMERKAGSPLPDLFRSLPGAVFPLYHVLADAGEYAGGEVVPVLSSDHLAVDGLVMERGGRRRAILANLTGEPQAVRVQGLGARVRVRSLDERNAEDAMRWPERFRAQEGDLLETDEGALACELMPYGVLRVDG